MRFLATADLHIKDKTDLPLLERLLACARKQQCDTLLFGGDLLDSPFPPQEVENGILALFADWGKPIFTAAGNHDPLAITALYQKLPANVTVFPEGMTAYTLGEHFRIYGYSAMREQSKRRPLEGFSVPAGETALLLGHGHFEGTDFQPVRPEELAASGLKLAILGHIHKGEQRQIGSTRLLVPGIPEGRGWDETGEKFVYTVEISPAGAVVIEPHSVAERLYREIRVDLSGCADTEEMLNRMEQIRTDPLSTVRLVLTGTPEESPAIAAKLYTERTGIETADETESPLSIEDLMGQKTLQGAFVRRAMAEINAASPEERPQLEEALKLGLRALREAKL